MPNKSCCNHKKTLSIKYFRTFMLFCMKKVLPLQPLLRVNGMKFNKFIKNITQNGNKNQIAARWP